MRSFCTGNLDVVPPRVSTQLFEPMAIARISALQLHSSHEAAIEVDFIGKIIDFLGCMLGWILM